MRILLPPSETKRSGRQRRPLDLAQLTAPELSEARAEAVDALERLSRLPISIACAALGISERQADELGRNASLHTAPTSPAHAIYDGVLFDALAFASRSPALRRRITECVLVQSALFGVVGLGDAIPGYRCSADSELPGLGRAAAFWKPRLAEPMARLLDGHCVVDMRSGAYAAMWAPPRDQREHLVTVRVMELRNGRRTAASHFNKATKGLLVADLAASRRQLRDAESVAGALAAAAWEVRLDRAADRSAVLEVMMRA